MTEAEMATIRFFIFLTLAVIFYAWPHRKLRAMAFEQDLRTIRNDLWDYMLQRGHGFNDPAYLDMRLCFNGFIRMTRHQKAGSWYVTILISRKWLSPPQLPTEFIPTDTALRQRLIEAESAMRRRVFKFLFLEGILALVLYPIRWLMYFSTRRDPFTKWQNLTSIKRFQHHAFYLGKMPIPQARLMLGLDKYRVGT